MSQASRHRSAPVGPAEPGPPWRAACRSLALVLVLAFAGLAGPALAHGGDESAEGYVLVQQALAHLAHDPSHVGQDLAMEKVDDALAAEDQDGVAVGTLARAKVALEAGRVAPSRRLLQASIAEAVSELPPAVGAETGTSVVAPALDARGALTPGDWVLLAASVLVLLLGLGLAYRLRPPESVADLRRRLALGSAAVGWAGHRHGRS